MSARGGELRYAVRFHVVTKYFGQLCLVVGLLTLVPLVAAVAFGDHEAALRYAVVVGTFVAVGLLASRIPATSRIQINEGIVVVVLIFLCTSLAMSYPFMAAGMSFMDALFEAVSGSTTTGLSTNASLGSSPPSFLLARAWMQWYGGLGIVVLSVVLVVRPGMTAKGLAVVETAAEDPVGGTRAHARHVLVVYTALTGGGLMLLLASGLAPFDAVLHVLTAVSTGGFTPREESLHGIDWPAQTAVMVLCVAGAIPLVWYYTAVHLRARGTISALQGGTLLVSSGILVVLLLLVVYVQSDGGRADVLGHAPSLAVSAHTGAGFSTTSPATLDPASKLLLMVGMLVGASAGSTAGGIKVLRLLIVLQVLRVIILRSALPQHAVLTPRLQRRPLEEQDIREAFTIILLFLTVIVATWLLFVASGFDPLDSLFDVISATATVGLSTGVVGPDLPDWLKGVLCLNMLMGRLEVLAWVVFLYPGTWIGRRLEAI